MLVDDIIYICNFYTILNWSIHNMNKVCRCCLNPNDVTKCCSQNVQILGFQRYFLYCDINFRAAELDFSFSLHTCEIRGSAKYMYLRKYSPSLDQSNAQNNVQNCNMSSSKL